ncbi:glycosyltransferase [Haladaptatus sp. DYSN1]|uniref:glycosyltransferase n=1 Tax=unclassified Haladaptatus TaxID=2622732 RepID=UPI002404EBDC|nr:glycosyltransferase [Haladaptatus sp. DYSN1]
MSESPIRVLWLTPDKPENISVGRRKIAEYLMTQGFDVTLRGTTTQMLVQSMRERNSYDVVVGTTRAGAIAGTLLSVVFSKPLLVDHIDPIRQFSETHPRWLSLPVRLLENVSFALADHVLYVYDEEAQRVRRYARLATQTDLGVSFDRFANPSDETLNRARRRLDDEGVAGNVVIYVGGLEPIYNIEHLLEAMTHLSDWTLVVLGTGDLESQVRTAATARENVVYLGTVPHDDVPGYLHAADVGISLVDDAHTLKVLEYGSAGLPVVQLRGHAEGRFSGLATFCSLDPAAIAEAIQTAIETTDTAAMRAASKRYDWASIGQVYESALRTIVTDQQ